MSEKQNREMGDLSQYDAMTTEELEEILRLDAQAPEDQESDIEKILYIMEVLTERKRNNSHTGNAALEAYESFKQNYMPEIDNTKSLHKVPAKARREYPRWARSLAATAAVLAVLLLGSVTARAFSWNIWDAVVKWTQETFHFGEWSNSNPRNNLQYQSFQEALEQGNIPVSIVPTRIPDGYELNDITVERSPFKKICTAIYANGEKHLRITVQDYLDKSPYYVEQSEGLVEKYDLLGITYYLFENNKQVQAVWIVDSYECYISGNVTIDDLKMMINSVEKG